MICEQDAGFSLNPDWQGESASNASQEPFDDADAEVCRALERSHLSLGKPGHRSWVATFRSGELVARRYVVDTFLARGGMGEVYSTFDQRLHQRVALKTLLSVAADDPASVRALHAEFELARRINHRNVCRVDNVGAHDEDPRDVVHFLAMELIDGESLATRLRRRRLCLGESLEIGRQLLLGLEATHQAGVLHRDVKSQNILLAERGQPLRAVLTDFGLARRLDASQRAPGAPNSGSLAYMAPEQMLGKDLSPATDLFAFGVLLFEMCTQRLPFKKPGEQRRATDTGEIFSDEVCKALPARLLDVIARCLSHSPAARYSSAAAALSALGELGGRS
jgi:eukaryotic-like serine/threonine-protein kinase